MTASELVAGLRSRHERSKQPSSRALVSAIDVVNETIERSGHEKSIAAYFGACLGPLDSTGVSEENSEIVTALCTLLATIMQQVPSSYLRTKFTTVSKILLKTCDSFASKKCIGGERAALQCLGYALRNMDTSCTWAPVAAPFAALLKATMHTNPKVRKVAQECLATIMASVHGTPAIQPSSSEIAAGVVQCVPRAGNSAYNATQTAGSPHIYT
jgi:hypothetical protein